MKEFDEALEKMLQREECKPYEVGYVSPVAVQKKGTLPLNLTFRINNK